MKKEFANISDRVRILGIKKEGIPAEKMQRSRCDESGKTNHLHNAVYYGRIRHFDNSLEKY